MSIDLTDFKPLSGFGDFIRNYNIIGMAIGTIAADMTLGMARELTDAAIFPIVDGIIKSERPKFRVAGLISAGIRFLVTMAVVYAMTQAFSVQMTKPVTYVRVVNMDQFPQPPAQAPVIVRQTTVKRAPAVERIAPKKKKTGKKSDPACSMPPTFRDMASVPCGVL